MQSLPFYLAHLLLLAAGIFVLRRLAGAGRLERFPVAGGAAATLALAGLTFAISEPQHQLFEDFIDAYYAAGAAVLAGPLDASKLFARGVHGFVGNPIVALLFAPFALLPPGGAALVFTGLGAAATLLAWRGLVRAAGLDLYRAAILALLFSLDGPLLNSLREGNTSHFVLLALVLAFASLQKQRDWTAGLLLGAAALLKLPILLFGAYFVLRRRWRALAGGALVLAGAAGLSLALFGLEAQLDWYERFVADAGRKPIAAFNVQSIPAFLGRWQWGGEALFDWNGRPLAADARAVSAFATLLLYAAAFGCALAPRRPGATAGRADPSPKEIEIEWMLVLVLACLTSPISWTHYYAWLLIPIAFVIAPSSPFADSRASRWLAWAGILLVLPPVILPGWALGGDPSRLSIALLSHYLFGGLLLLLVLLRARLRLRRQASP